MRPFVVTPAMGSGGQVLVRAIAVDGDLEGAEEFHIATHRSTNRADPDPDDPQPDTPPTLRQFVDEAQPAEMAIELRQTSTEDFFAMVDALKGAKATVALSQIQVGLAQEACAMRLGSDLRLSGEGVAAIVEAVRTAVAQENAVVTSQVKAVSFPTGRDLIAFVEAMKVEVGDPRTCVTQPQTRRT